MRISPASYHHLIPRAHQPQAGSADEINLGLLAIAYPQFRFSQHTRPRDPRPRWELVRTNPGPGLYALITTDLHELHAALTRDAEPAAGGQP